MYEEFNNIFQLHKTGFCQFNYNCEKKGEEQVCDEINDCKKAYCDILK